jgi:hypothetical protein
MHAISAISKVFAPLALALLLVGAALAGPLEDGVAAYEKKDYATALNLWKPLAEQGDPKAQFGLGVMYNDGEGVTKDQAEAVKWFRKAAEQGDRKAQTLLGIAYLQGQGVALDLVEAEKWIRKAAEQGWPPAQLMLGLMYSEGQGLAKDQAEATKWIRKAADGGFEAAKKHPLAANAGTAAAIPAPAAAAPAPASAAGDPGAAKQIGECVVDNKDEGQSVEILTTYCTCMGGKLNDKAQSISEWEKTHKMEEDACSVQASWKR